MPSLSVNFKCCSGCIFSHRDLSQDANVFTEINWDYLSCVLDFNLKSTFPQLPSLSFWTEAGQTSSSVSQRLNSRSAARGLAEWVKKAAGTGSFMNCNGRSTLTLLKNCLLATFSIWTAHDTCEWRWQSVFEIRNSLGWPDCGWRHTQALHTYRINLSPFTKDFRVWGAPIET